MNVPQPPLANLFVVHDADPATLDEMMLDFRRSAEFARVWRPAPGWVAAVAPLPGSSPDDDLARQHQFACAEGGDVLPLVQARWEEWQMPQQATDLCEKQRHLGPVHSNHSKREKIMENQQPQPTAPQSEAPVTQKLPYAPPKATFVPLKLEERLLACNKDPGPVCAHTPPPLLFS